jgi:ubiquinone/menaquinone biosynthesis C-methylase UbiE
MKGKMPDFAFRIMAHVAMPIRNLLMPPAGIFAEFDIQPGHCVLDYGCGPGVFSILAARSTGPQGRVYALDIHPLALAMVKKKAGKEGLNHVRPILSSGPGCLAADAMDRILLLDVLHLLERQQAVLAELHRVLKPGAVLYLSDHHMKETHIRSAVESSGLFSPGFKLDRSFAFAKKTGRGAL